MSNPYKRLKIFLHSTFNHDSTPPEHSTSADMMSEEDVYKFQPMKMCLEYKTDVKKAVKYPNNFPMPRSGHRIVCNDQHVISYGGYNPRTTSRNHFHQETELYKEIWKFDTVRKKWRLLDVANTPPYAASNCCTLIGSNILTIFGGTSFPFGEESGNDLYVLDLAEERGFHVVRGEGRGDERGGDKPPGRYGQAVVIEKNYLYSIGGTTGFVYSMDVHRLDLESEQWTCLYHSDLFGPGDPEPRYRHEVALYQGRIYVLGGGTEQKSFSLENIHSFDLATHTWSLHHTHPDPRTLRYPVARKCHALSQSRTNPAHLLLLGGVTAPVVSDDEDEENEGARERNEGARERNEDARERNEDAQERIIEGAPERIEGARERIAGATRPPVLDDVWRLDLGRLEWAQLPVTLPSRVYFHALATSPRDKIYIFGGITSGSGSRSRDGDNSSEVTERTADLYSVYLTIPSLEEIASEAVKYYARNRVYDETVLSSYGIHF